MAKKMGIDPENIENLSAEKKKKFFDAVDKGWKADKETDVDEATDLDEAAIALDDIVGNANQLTVQINNLIDKVDKAKKAKLEKAKKNLMSLGTLLKGIKMVHFKEGTAFGANFTTPAQEMTIAINEIERLINNFKQRGGDFKTYVPDLQKAYKILYKLALGR
jgi:hypothetical protein